MTVKKLFSILIIYTYFYLLCILYVQYSPRPTENSFVKPLENKFLANVL